jgi:hypothetical protein
LREADLPPAFSGSLSPFPFTVPQLPLLPPTIPLPPSSNRAAPPAASLLRAASPAASTSALARRHEFRPDADPAGFRPGVDPEQGPTRRPRTRSPRHRSWLSSAGLDASRRSPRSDLAKAHFLPRTVVGEAYGGRLHTDAPRRRAARWRSPCGGAAMPLLHSLAEHGRSGAGTLEPRRCRGDRLRLRPIHASRTASA